MRALEQERGDTLRIVQIAVVAVDGVRPARDPVERVARAIQGGVRILEAVEGSHRQGGVKAAAHFADGENEAVGGGRDGQKQTRGHKHCDAALPVGGNGRGISGFHSWGIETAKPPRWEV